MYKHARRAARPPPIVRLPRILPLSRLNGATPTRAAARRRVGEPSSGSSASSVRALTGPTPGTERGSPAAARAAARPTSRPPVGGFYREVRTPNLCGGLPFGDALGPDLPPPRPRPASHLVPPRRGPPAGWRDRGPARPPPVHRLPRAGARPLPRRCSRLLRLLPPERPGLGAPAPAAA